MKPSAPPRVAPPRATRKAKSVVIVNTGDGKGKSTAAFGTALRAVSRGWKVCVVQFIKSGRWKVGERDAAMRLGVEWWTIGDGFTWDSPDMERTEAVARGLAVLDEITSPMNWGWIPSSEVAAVIRSRPASVNIIATGRGAPSELIEVADTVTEMRNQKDAFDQGIQALRGIDF